MQPPADGRQPDARRLRPRQKHLVHRIQIPNRPRGHKPLPGNRHIHQRQIPILPVHPNVQRLAYHRRIRQPQLPRCYQPGGNPRQRPFNHHRKHIVRPRGNRHYWQPIGCRRHGPVRPVAAQGNQTPHALLRHHRRRPPGVPLRIVRRHRQQFQRNADPRIRRRPPAQIPAVRHCHHPRRVRRLHPDERPPHCVDLLPVRHHPPLRHQPANILAGRRIGNNSHAAHITQSTNQRNARPGSLRQPLPLPLSPNLRIPRFPVAELPMPILIPRMSGVSTRPAAAYYTPSRPSRCRARARLRPRRPCAILPLRPPTRQSANQSNPGRPRQCRRQRFPPQ